MRSIVAVAIGLAILGSVFDGSAGHWSNDRNAERHFEWPAVRVTPPEVVVGT
jgi:hypothetical protein